jgi:hypothetical protein
MAHLDTENIDYSYMLKFIDEKLKIIEENIIQLKRMEAALNKVKQNINSQTDCPIKNSFTNH